jgi:hypothetical protein
MSNKPILFFSNDCLYSKQFLTILSKYSFIDIQSVSIDPNPSTKTRPKVFYDVQDYLQYKITKVPTIVLFGNDNYAISGDEAFKWLKYTVNKAMSSQPKQPSIKEYNPNEMGSFSDSYSKYGSTDIHDTSEQSFQFIGKEQRIVTIPEEQFNGVDPKQKELERDQFINIQRPSNIPSFSEDFKNTTNPNSNLNVDYNQNNIPHIIPKKDIDFSNPNFGFASNYQEPSQFQSKTQKSKEFDNRLESLLSQRESHVPSNKPSVNPTAIDWTTGQIN